MSTYLLLMNLTDQGIKDVKNAPQRLENAISSLESVGGKMIAFYAVMGQYDYVAIVEAPSDEAALGQLLGVGMAGNVRTTTLKAFTSEQYADVLRQLP